MDTNASREWDYSELSRKFVCPGKTTRHQLEGTDELAHSAAQSDSPFPEDPETSILQSCFTP